MLTIATISPDPSPASAPNGEIGIAPGRAMINTPANPSTTASHRQRPAFSPSITVLRTTANSGVVKLRMVETASGSSIAAPNTVTMPIMPVTALRAWLPSRRVASEPSRPRALSPISSNGKAVNWRQNIISGNATPLREASFTSINMVDSASAEARRSPSANRGR